MQFILVNRTPGIAWHQNDPESVDRELFCEVRRALPEVVGSSIRIGVGVIFSYLESPSLDQVEASLKKVLYLARETETPVFIQFDGENWWGGRPDLWNWWDPSKPGYDPRNRENVEWTSWESSGAVKIAWRNWGSQIRILPPPNLMSPAYRKACQEALDRLLPVLAQWWFDLPEDKTWLLAGVKVGHESSIGVNAWVYPHSEALAERPVSEDPTTGTQADDLPSRGVVQIGYAAVKAAGIRDQGEIMEADLAEVVRRHLEWQSEEVARAGLPMDRIFTHCGGWRQGEALFGSALNAFACPGWSFYSRAWDPREDQGVQASLSRTEAPFWGAVEWLYMGPREVDPWRQALENTLSDSRCRLLCIYNWEGIRESPPILEAIQEVSGHSATWDWIERRE